MIHTHQRTLGSEKFQKVIGKSRKYPKIYDQDFRFLFALNDTDGDSCNDVADEGANICTRTKIFNIKNQKKNGPKKIINTAKRKEKA